MLVDVACEATFIGTSVEVREVAVVQTEDIVPIRRVCGERHDHLMLPSPMTAALMCTPTRL